ncbi:MAG: U32 family peptidase [Thermoguttaceae bacterium]|nr:U32 family peptidase [Thermoguttaceae bacterium]
MKIMAPAGDFDRLVAAVKAGADEVYMGVAGFGARRFAKNFSVEEYADAIDFAHRSNVSVHLTFNTVLSDAELDLVEPDLRRLYEAGLDEVIVQDFGAVSFLRDRFPDLPLCASTQFSPGTAAELNWLAAQGFHRAVLARELSLDEIRSIRSQTSLELEVFASGALCLGCSGKCYLSSFIGGRSGNRGMCAQPCRQYYRMETLAADAPELALATSDRRFRRLRRDELPADAAGSASVERPSKRPAATLDFASNAEYGYFLSLKDQLQGRAELAELLAIGVDSIKIEGRMKSPVYVYTTVRYYRDLLDSLTGVSASTAAKRLSLKKSTADADAPTQGDLADAVVETARRREIAGIFNRGYDFGYFREHDPAIINEFFSSNFGVEIGRVRRDAVRLSAPLVNGDGVVFLDATARKLDGLNVGGIRLVDPTNSRRTKLVERAEPGDLVRFDVPIPPEATVLYRTFDHRLNKTVENALKQIRRREPISARLTARVDRPLELTLKTARAVATVRSEQSLEHSQKRPADEATLRDGLDRFGETPFYLDDAEIRFDADVFVPKSLLNGLRQEAVEALERKIVESYRRVCQEPVAEIRRTAPTSPINESAPLAGDALIPYFTAVVRNRAQFDVCRRFGIDRVHFETQPVQFENRPRYQEAFQRDADVAPLAGSLASAVRFERSQASIDSPLDSQPRPPFALDWTFNVGNARAVRYLADRFASADLLYLSPEISDRAVDAIFADLAADDYLAKRRLTLGLPVFGRLLAMFTQKTLFDAPFVRLTNADERRFLVEKNANRLPPTGDAAVDARPVVGSAVYLADPVDLLDAIPAILRSGIGAVRFDFTNETPAEVERVLRRALAPTPPSSRDYSVFSYGYSRNGVF